MPISCYRYQAIQYFATDERGKYIRKPVELILFNLELWIIRHFSLRGLLGSLVSARSLSLFELTFLLEHGSLHRLRFTDFRSSCHLVFVIVAIANLAHLI